MGDARRQRLHHAHAGGGRVRHLRSQPASCVKTLSADRRRPPHAQGGLRCTIILALGRADPQDERRAIQHGLLALRGSALCLGVSRLHGEFSRRIFQPLFPRWPACEVPIGHVTNGVHIPTWDSVEADRIWTESCGKERWRSAARDASASRSPASPTRHSGRCAARPPASAWSSAVRRHLVVAVARARLRPGSRARRPRCVLDPNVLTIGFARRFTATSGPICC